MVLKFATQVERNVEFTNRPKCEHTLEQFYSGMYSILACAESFRILDIAIVAPLTYFVQVIRHFNSFKLTQHLLSHQKQAQIGENEAIHTLLIKFYSISFKISFQGFDISFKDITFDAMLEMLSRKPITPASFDSVMKKFTKSAFKMGSYLLEMSSDPGLQHTETELNGIEVRRVWWQISYLTPV